MKHLRYIVYTDKNDPTKKEVALWTEDIVHASYARTKKITPVQLCSLGYIGYSRSKWVLYEHYQLNDASERNDKLLVQKALHHFPEIHSVELARELERTYKAEKHLLINGVMRSIMNLFARCSRTR